MRGASTRRGASAVALPAIPERPVPQDDRSDCAMALIEIGRRNYLLYLVLPHPVKMALLSDTSRAKLDVINRLSNETTFSGTGAVDYDRNHRYGEAEQHDHPCRRLIEEIWAPEGYGRALDLGAGS